MDKDDWPLAAIFIALALAFAIGSVGKSLGDTLVARWTAPRPAVIVVVTPTPQGGP